jgi:hypothetical protein
VRSQADGNTQQIVPSSATVASRSPSSSRGTAGPKHTRNSSQPSSQLDVIDDFRFEPLGCLRVTRASRAAQADGCLDPWLPLPLAEDHSRL